PDAEAADGSPSPDRLRLEQAQQTHIKTLHAFYALVASYWNRYRANADALPGFEREWLLEEVNARLAGEPSPRPSLQSGAQKTLLAEPTLCAELNKAILGFTAEHESTLRQAAKAVNETMPGMDETARAELARAYASAFPTDNSALGVSQRRAQKILYFCIYRTQTPANKPRTYSVERTMRRFNEIQAPLTNAWLGNLD
ncbi:MAG: hypothetical protein FWC40_06650, partial [Proteobacteria bacterium]|nr:hypothetical protein [Pseudomonadota bacterium]